MKKLRKSRLALSIMLVAGMLFGQNAYGETENTAAEPEIQSQTENVAAEPEIQLPTEIVAAEPEIQSQAAQAQVQEEMTELRTENTMTFKTDQPNVYVRKVFNGQKHYQGEDGQFYEIATDITDDNIIESVNDKKVSKDNSQKLKDLKKTKADKKKDNKSENQNADGSYHAFHVPFQAELPKNIARGYSIGKGSDELSLIPQNAKPSKGKKDPAKSDTMLYENVWESTHVKLSITPTGVKEDIVMLNAQAPDSFTFEVKGKLDKELKSGELTVLPAWLEDSTGQRRDVTTTKRTAGNKTYLDLTWDDAGLVYPVTIDPSITIQKSSAYYTCSDSPNTLYEGVRVGSDNTKKCITFLQFSGIQLPAVAQVTNVDLTIYGYISSNNSSLPVTVRQLFTPITPQLNYDNQPVWLNASSVTTHLPYTPKYETYTWRNLGIDTASFRTGLVQLGMYYGGSGSGMLLEGSVSYGGKTELVITYTDNPKSRTYNYDINGRLSSIRSATGHLVNGTYYDKNGNSIKKLAPYYTMLENHDFREGSKMWSMGQNMSISNEMSVDGNGSLKFYSAAATTAQSVTQSYPIKTGSGKNLILSFDILDNTTSGKVYVTWKEYNYNGEYKTGSQLVSTTKGQWKRQSISFSTTLDTTWIQVQIVADAGTKGTAYVDFVRLRDGVYNSGFDVGLLGWSGDSNITLDSEIKHDGRVSMRFRNSSSPATTRVSNGLNRIKVDAGTTYSLSAWFYNDLTAGNMAIEILEIAEDGSPVANNYFSVTGQQGTRTWFNKNFMFTTNIKTRSVIMYICFNSAAGSAYVDHLELS